LHEELSNHSYFTSILLPIKKGDYLKVGVGSMPDGDFKYIRTNSGSLLNVRTDNMGSFTNNSYQNQANAFSRSNSGLKFKVLRVENRGTKKNGYVYYAIITDGFVRYEVDVENAIITKELVLPNEYQVLAKIDNNQTPVSVADEITKLKKLMDDNVITKEEFENQKKKLL
jgi:hypothetical protein